MLLCVIFRFSGQKQRSSVSHWKRGDFSLLRTKAHRKVPKRSRASENLCSINHQIPSFQHLTCLIFYWKVMRQSKNAVIKLCFPSTEPDSKKRPETVRNVSDGTTQTHTQSHNSCRPVSTCLCNSQVVTQFKNSLAGLTEILLSKEPWYVRCIKPNEAKQPGESLRCEDARINSVTFLNDLQCSAGRFDDVLVRHQVKYLGLMEHLRVRRAGFAYRRKYEIFLQRYLAAHSLWCPTGMAGSGGVERCALCAAGTSLCVQTLGPTGKARQQKA